MKVVFCAAALVCFIATTVEGHGYLLKPPARGSAWRAGFNTPANSNDMANFCGGRGVQHSPKNGGKCGVCGEEYSDTNKRLEPGPANKFATGTIVGNYKQGDTIDVTIMLTAFHKGYFEFRLCENNVPQKGKDSSIAVTIDCLNKNLLTSARTGETRLLAITGKSTHEVKLPADVTCTACVLQWRYRTGNNWGCENDKCASGLGPQEEFFGCSDIAIAPQGNQPQVEITTSKPETLKVTAQEPTDATSQKPTKAAPQVPTNAPTQDPTDATPQDPTKAAPQVPTNAPPQEATKPTTQIPTIQKPIPTTVKKPTTLKTIIKLKPEPSGRKSCSGKGAFAASMKYWCNINCNHRPPHCPRSHCVCRYTQ